MVNHQNYYYIEDYDGDHRNAIIRNLQELIKDIHENKSEDELFIKLENMFLLDKEFDRAMIFFIRNSTHRFILDNK